MQIAIEIPANALVLPRPRLPRAVRWELSVLVQLVLREVRLQHRGTALGLLWAVASPLALCAVYLGLCDGVLGARFAVPARSLLAALIPWSGFTAALCAAAHAPLTHAALLRGHRVPVRIAVAAAGLAALPALLPGRALLAATGPHSSALAALPLLVLVQLGLALAAGQVLALANALARDTQHALHYALRLGFFLTPILWAPSPTSTPWLVLNPFTGLIAAYRAVLVEAQPPGPAMLAPALMWMCVLSAAGLAAERGLGRRVVELI